LLNSIVKELVTPDSMRSPRSRGSRIGRWILFIGRLPEPTSRLVGNF